jgi:hypothetical protein
MCSIKIVIIGVASIVIQFGLAIAGWGGWSTFLPIRRSRRLPV